jgi:hypothetical protein
MNESTTVQTPKRPAPLDPTRLHTPAEVRQWKHDEATYWAAMQALQDEERRKEEAARAHANRLLDADEYFELAQQREADNKARQFERDAARKAEELRKQEYLASNPPTAEILVSNNIAEFLRQFEHWVREGYEVDTSGPLHIDHMLCHLTLTRAAQKRQAKMAA